MIFSINQRSLSVGTTEGSASAESTTEGSAEVLAEGAFGRSLPQRKIERHVPCVVAE